MRDGAPTFSTSIQLTSNRIHYRIEKQWIEFEVREIQVIGEFSAPPGLLPADYFFSFKLRGQDEMIDIPFYTDGLFEVLAALKRRLPGLGNPQLQMATDFDSNVMYPAHVAGKPLYEFHSEVSPWIDLPLVRNIARKQKVRKVLRQDVMVLVN